MTQKINGSAGPMGQVATPPKSSETARAGSGSPGDVGAVRASDEVRLTGEAESLRTLQKDTKAGPAPVDAAKVARLSEAVNAGTYEVQPAAIAEAMVKLDRELGA